MENQEISVMTGKSEETELHETYNRIQGDILSSKRQEKKPVLMTDGGSPIKRQNTSGWGGDLPEENRERNGRWLKSIKEKMGW